MPFLTLKGEPSVKLYYEDTGGEGRPIVLIHGWPLSGAAFEGNLPSLTEAGYRVVTYDRRGFGRSDKPEQGYEYDTLASDLNELMTELDLTDAVILGFSMGGGEVVRYVSAYGSGRLAGAVLSGSITPALCITDDNPDGAMPFEGFQGMADSNTADQAGFLNQFVTWFFSNNEGLTVTEEQRQAALDIALASDVNAGSQCILAWATDLRADCAAIDVPTLLIHGDGDQNVPLAKSSVRAHQVIDGSVLHVIAGGPHGANVSHREEWDNVLADFLATL